ncbi:MULTISPECIES: putative holin-like toxin [Paenibacillus]|nr:MULTISPECIES: putative holin-like toxin [Paenibacillus]SDC87535.1 hypothetical protein SAMN05428987_3137 [Paenibacillus sp. CF095]
MSTYESLTVMLNFGSLILTLLAFIISILAFMNAKKR